MTIVRRLIPRPPLLLLVVLGLGLWPDAGFSAPADAARRLARVDEQGVLRWQDNREEVALFGVNYYTPFWHNYPDLKAVGADHKQVIDQDVAHFARMGLDALRIHVFDREVSDRDGNLVGNEHLLLLDYLIAQAQARGIYTVLTPIAWWGSPSERASFSADYTMSRMTTDRAAWRTQTNYLAQFVCHTNRFTGLSYKDDPAVVCFELINEPQYPPKTTDAQIVDYINTLADAVRGTGSRKPVFYNGWGNRLAAVRDARVDGSTFGWYPTGLASGRSLRRNFLPVVDEYGGSDHWTPSMRSEALARKAKIIYEFDAADVPGSFMYPAMARSFRSGGAQIATQFQYDPLPLAPFNQGWQTHFLNLVCAPQKAVSFLIAGEAFRRLPRLGDYGRYPASARFGAFRVSFEEDLSEMVTEREFLHSNTTRTEPPAPDKLERVIGCGSSPVVSYEGTGAHFLERLAPGAWRLEVYPDAVWVNDPYGAHSLNREVARMFWRAWMMTVRLPDLGTNFSVEPLSEGSTFRPKAVNGRIPIVPGVYLLQRAGLTGDAWKTARLPARVGLREFYALPGKDAPTAVRHEPVGNWVEGKALTVAFTVASPEEPEGVALEFRRSGKGEAFQSLPLQRTSAYQFAAALPEPWLVPGQASYRFVLRSGGNEARFPTNAPWPLFISARTAPVTLFDAERHKASLHAPFAFKKSLVPGMTNGHRALHIAVEKFSPAPSALAFRTDVTEELEPWREAMAGRTILHLRARALEPTTKSVEVVVLERDTSPWGANLPLTTEWCDVRVPLASLKHFGHWGGSTAQRGGKDDHLRPQEIAGVSVCFGAWLYPNHADEPHTIEIESVAVEQ